MIDLRQGDCLEVMRTLPDESVNCVICSPPYWGLRDYGTPPVVFGGDSECGHEWTSHVKPAANGLVNNEMQGETLSGTSATRKPTTSAYCAKCSAWRGQLGLEPTFAEFLAHMVEIFEECRRVLRNDGTCWINMGDAYSGSRGAQSRGNTTGEDKVTLQGSSQLSANQISAAARGTHTGSQKRTGLQAKNLIGQPWRLAFALQDAGWILRSDIIWHKPNPMPESVTDRPTRSHEYVFLLVKSKRYWYEADAIAEPVTPSTIARVSQPNWEDQEGSDRAHAGGKTNGNMKAVVSARDNFRRESSKRGAILVPGQSCGTHRPDRKDSEPSATRNARTVWTIATQGYPDAHFATFPEELPKRCILAGCPEGGTVLDIFAGSGTTLAVAVRLGRNGVGIELNPEYVELARQRIDAETPSLFAGVDD